ncbi:MAG: FkbM family methyltransferase, partial [Actinomycetota bacterium]
MFVSYAQNGEDIVLWRILQDVSAGRYVDVGAADPTESSVTRAFYDRGWSGINVEPVPEFANRLDEERPRDSTFRCAASDQSQDVALFVAGETGLSTIDPSLVPSILDRGYEVERIPVSARPLNDILDEAGFNDQPIHFLKVDVEGAEAQVLAGLDLSRWRPWVLVVEATAPMSTTQNHEQWEVKVLESGYTFCLFDGLNRFYVANEHPERVAIASYPVCTFDHPYLSEEYERYTAASRKTTEQVVVHLKRELEVRETYVRDITERIQKLDLKLSAATADALRWRGEALCLRSSTLTANDLARRAHARAAAEHETSENRREALDAMIDTVSWKVTRPLRAVRRVGNRRDRNRVHTAAPTTPLATANVFADLQASVDDGFVRRFCDRVVIVTTILDPTQATENSSLEQAMVAFERAVEHSRASVMTKAWLALVSVLGTYPEEPTLEEAARVCRLTGGRGLGQLMLEHLEKASRDPAAVESELEVVHGGVLVDVSHTAAHDLHTGIQRVVRELSSRWLSNAQVVVVQWNFWSNSVKRLSDDEAERLRNWREHLHDSGTAVQIRALAEQTGKTVIPWGSVLVLPELVASPRTCSGYRALARSGVIARCSLIGYDSVPMTAAETVTEGMTANF